MSTEGKAARIGTLNVRVQADTTKLSSGLKKAAAESKSFTAQIQASLSDLTKSFTVAGAVGLGVGIASGVAESLASAFVTATKETLESVKAQKLFAERIGISRDELASLELMAKRVGINADQLRDALSDMQEKIGDAQQNRSGLALEAFRGMGLELKDMAKLKPEQQLRVIADGIRKIDNQADKLHIVDSLFGEPGQRLLPLFEQGAAGMDRFLARAKEMGLVFDGRTIANFDRANQSIATLNVQAEAFQKGFVGAFSGDLAGVTSFFARLGGGLDNLGKHAAQFVKSMFPVVSTLTALLNLPGFQDGMFGAVGIKPVEEDPLAKVAEGIEKTSAKSVKLAEEIADLKQSIRGMNFGFEEGILSAQLGSEVGKIEAIRKRLIDAGELDDATSAQLDRAEELAMAQKKAQDERKWREEDQGRLKSLKEAVEKPADTFAKRMTELKKWRDDGRINAEEFRRGSLQARRELGEGLLKERGQLRFGGAALQGSSEARRSMLQTRFTMDRNNPLLNVNNKQLVVQQQQLATLKAMTRSPRTKEDPLF